MQAAVGGQRQSELARLDAAENGNAENFIDRNMRVHDQTPMIYICGTMWHESDGEMITMLKSLFK